MAWIIKIKIPKDERAWYVTKIARNKKSCDITSNQYSAKLYKKMSAFEGLDVGLHQIIEVPESETFKYEQEK